jgi:arginine decarboxylase
MDTPIADFVKEYSARGGARFHMPGHKGRPFLGGEPYDITEVHGADALYEADGIIEASERNAARLFGTARTLFSTEGSSQCIRAMVYLAVTCRKDRERPYILAARNAHKAFLYALALVDADISWLWPQEMNSLCSCQITPQQVEMALKTADRLPAAVYITSPDYLGHQLPVREIARVCHDYGTPLLVDNAHGAYLHFLPEAQHPMDLGADLCCDSAHKTLPVLTGGAYLHISPGAPPCFASHAKEALAIFGSTSPSYLTLASLDLCNQYLDQDFRERLREKAEAISRARETLVKNGWTIENAEPLKLTITCPTRLSGLELAQTLRDQQIECEYADREYLVLMASTETTQQELDTLIDALGKNTLAPGVPVVLRQVQAVAALTVRKAIFSPQERVPISQAVGRICAAPAVGCPPAIPIAVSGEIIDENARTLFSHYGIDQVSVVKQY